MTRKDFLLDFMRGFAWISARKLSMVSGINYNTVRRELAESVKALLVAKIKTPDGTVYYLKDRYFRYQFDYNFEVFPKRDEEGYNGDARITAIIRVPYSERPRDVFANSLYHFLGEEIPWSAKLTEYNEEYEEVTSSALRDIPLFSTQRANFYAEVSFSSGIRMWRKDFGFVPPSLPSLKADWIRDVLSRLARGEAVWTD